MESECSHWKSFETLYPSELLWLEEEKTYGDDHTFLWPRTVEALKCIASHNVYYSEVLFDEFIEEVEKEKYKSWNLSMSGFYKSFGSLEALEKDDNVKIMMISKILNKVIFFIYKKHELCLMLGLLAESGYTSRA